MKKLIAVLLVMVMMLGVLSACTKPGNTTSTPAAPVAPELEGADGEIYTAALGEYYQAYYAAKAETNVSKKYALMAIAEAKLMEAAVMLPLTTNGGNYAISRVAPYTVDYQLWGNDSYRYYTALVATTFIKAEHRDAMKAKWAELKGTGTYYAWAKNYLVENGYTLKDSYKLGYSSDPQTWDVLATSRAADSEAIVNTYDGLVEYDCEGNLKPALAESWTVSEDGKTYTFKIRQGAKWVDSQGRELADVTADDFVAGMQHMMDAMGGLEYLVDGVILNAGGYIDGDVTDFAEVGVKATDTYTLVYTLEKPVSYFMTMLGYGVFAPMNRAYYESKGGKFGYEYDSAAEDYTYGTSPDTIAYCGPYVVTNNTASNTIVFSANDKYWNKDAVAIKTLTWLYNDGKDPLKAYNDAVAGTLDGAGLNTAALAKARTEGYFEPYGYVSGTDATSFCAFYNLNRQAKHNFNDETIGVSQHTEESLALSKAALSNVHFRRAMSFATDRKAYNAQAVGDELALTSLRNCYTPGNFVRLTEDVTVSINGTDKTFTAGTYYGAIMQAQLDADNFKAKVWDPTAENGAGSSDGFDGWYNVENAKAELALAIADLEAAGYTVSAENPVKIEYPYLSTSSTYANRAQSYKQSIETALEGKVEIVLIELTDIYDWYYAGYFANNGTEMNYDVYDVSGWGPDYGDPSTYLDTFLPEGAGYMTMLLGIY